MFTLTQNRRNKTGQSCARTHFYKNPHAVCVHRFNFGDKLNRFSQLSSQKCLGFRCVGRILGGGAVGIDRNPGCFKFCLFNGGQKRYRSVGNQWAVEGGRHRKSLAGKFALGKDFCRTFDFNGTPRQDCLGRCIAIGDYQIQTFFGYDLFDGCQWSGNRQHTSLVAGACAHQAAAYQRQLVKHLFIKYSGSTECGQLTVAVAGYRFGGDAE